MRDQEIGTDLFDDALKFPRWAAALVYDVEADQAVKQMQESALFQFLFLYAPADAGQTRS